MAVVEASGSAVVVAEDSVVAVGSAAGVAVSAAAVPREVGSVATSVSDNVTKQMHYSKYL